MKSKLIPLTLVALCVGCSSSTDDNATIIVGQQASTTEQAEQAEQSEDSSQFSIADVNGSSDLTRVSYPVVRDLSRELVTGAYLDSYFDINTEISSLMVDALGGIDAYQNGEVPENEWQPAYGCPDGGSVTVKYTGDNIPNAPRQAEFTACKLQGRTLTGLLARTQSSGVTGGGAYSDGDYSFDNLIIDSDEGGTLTISGTSSTSQSSSSPDAISDRGACVLDGFGLQYSGSINLGSARIEDADQAGVISVNDLSYEWSDSIDYDASSNEANCPQSRATTESGTTDVSFESYSAAALNGDATISTTVATDIDATMTSHTATQATEMPDASSVTVTALPDTECMTQVDISADSAALSFNDNYCFVLGDLNLTL